MGSGFAVPGMPGVYKFEAETDPGKIAAAEERFIEWNALFNQIMSTRDEHGWDSPECQLARIEYQQWQQERRFKDAETENPGHSIIQ